MARWPGAVLVLSMLALTGCGPRVIVATGTTIGIKATPGDGQTRPPQLVIGYKRAEAALIPVEGGGAEKTGDTYRKESASTLSSFYLKNEWTATTQIRSFIGTGFAAREIIGKSNFKNEFAAATGMVPSADIVERQQKLAAQFAALNREEAKAKKVLDLADYPNITNKNAVDSLQEYIVNAKTKPALATLESAFARAR